MGKLIFNIRIDWIAFALHGIGDSVLDSQEPEQEEQKVV